MGDGMEPNELPYGAVVEISHEESGVFTARYYPDASDRTLKATAEGATLDEAVCEAVKLWEGPWLSSR